MAATVDVKLTIALEGPDFTVLPTERKGIEIPNTVKKTKDVEKLQRDAEEAVKENPVDR